MAQLNPERQAWNKIKKSEWTAARKILNKSLRKDSLNIEAVYVYTTLFLNPKYYQFNPDSAHLRLKKTIQLYSHTDQRSKDRLKRFPLDSIILERLHFQIDSSAFEKAKLDNSERGYLHFIKWYTDASQVQQAIELRDEAAFVVALKQNSYQSFQEFLGKYPNSHRANEAKQRYEKQLFEFSTKNKSLNEFREYVRLYPTSPYATICLKNIFAMSTLDGSERNFMDFIKHYPTGEYSKISQQILFHLRIGKSNEHELPDTLKNISPLREWMPVTENGKWGFMDEHGQIMLMTDQSGLHEKYTCSPLNEDFIHGENGILTRNGSQILVGRFSEVQDLGSGFLSVKTDSSNFILHKSGWLPAFPQHQETALIGSRFVALKNAKGWGLFALNGNAILPMVFQKIVGEQNFLILTKSKKEILVGFDYVLAYSKGIHEPMVADEIKPLGDKIFWVRNGSLEKVLNENLKEIIPFDRHSISYSSGLLMINKNNLITVKGWPSLERVQFSGFQIVKPWLITQKPSEKQTLHYLNTQKEIAIDADSVWFDQSFAAIRKDDSVYLLQSPTKFFSLAWKGHYLIRKTIDSAVFVLVPTGAKTTVYEATAFRKLFTVPFSEIEPFTKNIFLFKEKGKQGLLNDKGQPILKAEYDAIIFFNGMFSLLKGKKFGSYNPSTKKLLKPTFDSNLKSYGSDWIIARKENKLAFINQEGKQHTAFDFEEIEHWSDSLALVRNGRSQSLYSIPRKKYVLENLSEFQILRMDTSGRLAIFKQPSGYGLVEATLGLIVKPELEELTYQTINESIIFIGLKPVDKEMAEVKYYQSSGKIIRSNVMERKIAYGLFCDE